MRLLFVMTLGAVACSDYSLVDEKDPPLPNADSGGPPETTPDSDPPTRFDPPEDSDRPVDTGPEPRCEDLYFPAEPAPETTSCAEPIPVGALNPVVKWQKSSWSWSPTSSGVFMAPVVAQLSDDNGDGVIDALDTPDIAVISTGVGIPFLRVVSGDTGAELLNLTLGDFQLGSSLAAADLDGDGSVDLVGVTEDGAVRAFERDGTVKWTSGAYPDAMALNGDVVSIADMDGDGSPEVIVGALILNADGTTRGVGAGGCGRTFFGGAVSVPADLDGNGVLELATGNTLYDPDGNILWQNDELDGAVAVADMDLDGLGEIVVAGFTRLRLQDTDGTVLWEQTLGTSFNDSVASVPTIADLDGDGVPEILLMRRESLQAWTAAGQLFWDTPAIDTSSGSVSTTVFDFEGDGAVEVVLADQFTVHIYEGATGVELWSSTAHGSGTIIEYAIVADVDGDHHAEIVFGSNGSVTGLTVLEDANDSWMDAPRYWSQHGETFTAVAEDGAVLPAPTPNWPSRNNFRVPPLTTAGGERPLPDPLVTLDDLCELRCEQGELVVYARVGNGGTEPFTGPVTVVLEGVNDAGSVQLDTATLTGPFPPTMLTEGVRLEAQGVDALGLRDLQVRVETTAEDCEPANNLVSIGRAPCGE
ncbi:MAG: VCBS repeat-containing protein [Alphaproteobacteria bacterium]|nr:VCBS repeat-containing protein [Alphaproteobacteria bacterium]